MKKEFFDIIKMNKQEFSALSAASRKFAKNYFALYEIAQEHGDKESEEYYLNTLLTVRVSADIERDFI